MHRGMRQRQRQYDSCRGFTPQRCRSVMFGRSKAQAKTHLTEEAPLVTPSFCSVHVQLLVELRIIDVKLV